MTTFAPPASSGRVKAMRQAAGRVPLRIKLVAALLALVVIALAVISMVGLAQFRSYLQDRADLQLKALSAQVGDSSGIGGLRSPEFVFEGYAIQLRDTQGQQVRRMGIFWSGRTYPGALFVGLLHVLCRHRRREVSRPSELYRE